MRVRSLAWAALLALAACATPETVTPEPPPAPTGVTAPGRVTTRLLVHRLDARAALVVARVELEAGWRVYGLRSHFGAPPKLELSLPRGIALDGPLVEPLASPEVALDDLPIMVHRGRVAFTQRLALEDDGPVSLGATFTWQVCDDGDSYCAPGRADATLVLPGVDRRAAGPWELGDERASVTATIDRDESGRCLLRVAVNGRGDWWVQPLPLEVATPPDVEQRLVEPLLVEVLAPADAAGQPIHLTVRWRGQTAAGTPGEGSVSASLPIPPSGP